VEAEYLEDSSSDSPTKISLESLIDEDGDEDGAAGDYITSVSSRPPSESSNEPDDNIICSTVSNVLSSNASYHICAFSVQSHSHSHLYKVFYYCEKCHKHRHSVISFHLKRPNLFSKFNLRMLHVRVFKVLKQLSIF
jgi:hypothetical protein